MVWYKNLRSRVVRWLLRNRQVVAGETFCLSARGRRPVSRNAHFMMLISCDVSGRRWSTYTRKFPNVNAGCSVWTWIYCAPLMSRCSFMVRVVRLDMSNVCRRFSRSFWKRGVVLHLWIWLLGFGGAHSCALSSTICAKQVRIGTFSIATSFLFLRVFWRLFLINVSVNLGSGVTSSVLVLLESRRIGNRSMCLAGASSNYWWFLDTAWGSWSIRILQMGHSVNRHRVQCGCVYAFRGLHPVQVVGLN